MEKSYETGTSWLVTRNRVLKASNVVSIDQDGKSIYVTYVSDTDMNWEVMDIGYDSEEVAVHVWERTMEGLAKGRRSVSLNSSHEDELSVKEQMRRNRRELKRLGARMQEETPEDRQVTGLEPELIEGIKALLEKEKKTSSPGDGSTEDENLLYKPKSNDMWIMTSDLMISLGNTDIIRLNGKTISISFKPAMAETRRGEGQQDITVTFPKEDEAITGWTKLNEAVVKNHRYVSLQNGYTSIRDVKSARKSWLGK